MDLTKITNLLGDFPDGAKYAAALVFVLILILLVSWMLKKVTARVRIGGRRGGRLKVQESIMIDANRTLSLVKCDETEHLILLGDSGDLVVASNLQEINPLARTLQPATGPTAHTHPVFTTPVERELAPPVHQPAPTAAPIPRGAHPTSNLQHAPNIPPAPSAPIPRAPQQASTHPPPMETVTPTAPPVPPAPPMPAPPPSPITSQQDNTPGRYPVQNPNVPSQEPLPVPKALNPTSTVPVETPVLPTASETASSATTQVASGSSASEEQNSTTTTDPETQSLLNIRPGEDK